MSVSNLTKEFDSPTISSSGKKYYDQSARCEPEVQAKHFLQKNANPPEDSLSTLFAKNAKFTVIDKGQNKFKHIVKNSPLVPTILPTETIKFFAKHAKSDFNPYRVDKHNLVHKQLKKIVDHFETFTRGLPLKEKISAAEQIISEIRMAGAVKYIKENSKKASMEEIYSEGIKARDEPPMSLEALQEYFEKNNEGAFSIEQAMLKEKSEGERSAATLFELGARFYLSCSLFKTQSMSMKTKTRDIAAVYNFMTKNNTFVPYWGSMRLAMHPNLLGRIGSNIADLLTVTHSADAALAQANELTLFYVNKMKNMINKGQNEDIVYLEGDSELRKQDSTVQNKSINVLLKSTEIMYRHILAKKVISSLSASYKAVYQKNGKLPRDIAQTIAKITAFLQLPSEPPAIKKALHTPCDPAKDLLAGIFDAPQDKRASLERVEREAQEQHNRTNSWIRFLPFIRTIAHDKIERIKERKIDAIHWAAKQWASKEAIPYSGV